MSLLPQSIADAVARDGLSRVATADDGSQHVLYLDGDTVRSLSAADWIAQRGPLPTDPTPEQSAAAIAARQAAQQQAATDAIALRQRVLAVAQSAVGVQLDQLTAVQQRALLASLIYRAGGIDKSGAVQPLGLWL